MHAQCTVHAVLRVKQLGLPSLSVDVEESPYGYKSNVTYEIRLVHCSNDTDFSSCSNTSKFVHHGERMTVHFNLDCRKSYTVN